MNEWSPGGNYSCPATPNQTGRSFRSKRSDAEKATKPHVISYPGIRESRNFQQHSMEDVSKKPSSNNSKKLGGTGSADPRFKRVIPLGVQNNACVGTEANNQKASLSPERKDISLHKFPIWNAPDFKPSKSWVENVKNSEQSKLLPNDSGEPGSENITTPEDSNNDQSQDNLNAVDKLAFNHDIALKSTSKESISECTVNTRTTSLVSDEFAEYSNKLDKISASTRVKKVENWIHDQAPKIEKKLSVITVIGQMQEPNLSSELQEIDKRRKLVKELDKFAVCKKITDTDKDTEISNLAVKLSSFNDNEKVLFCDSNDTFNTSSHNTKHCGNKLNKQSDLSNAEKTVTNLNESNVDPPIPVSRKSSSKKNLKKVTPETLRNSEYFFKAVQESFYLFGFIEIHVQNRFFSTKNHALNTFVGKLGVLLSVLPYQKMLCTLIFLSGLLCWFAFFSIQKSAFLSFEFFNSKPKPITWYEKLCSWIWEFFRPYNNYHRTTQWRSY